MTSASKLCSAQFLLLLNLMFYPFSVFACAGEGGPFLGATAVLLMLEAVLIGFAYLGVWLKRKFWPAQAGVTSSAWFYIFLIAATLAAIVLALMGTLFIPEFDEIFAIFGAELPEVTQAVRNYRYVLTLAILAVAILWQWSKNKPRRAVYFAYFLLLEMGLVLFVLWALYQPVFVMGCAG